MSGANSPDGALATRERAELDLTVPTYRGSTCDPPHLKTQSENDNARILHTVRISTHMSVPNRTRPGEAAATPGVTRSVWWRYPGTGSAWRSARNDLNGIMIRPGAVAPLARGARQQVVAPVARGCDEAAWVDSDRFGRCVRSDMNSIPPGVPRRDEPPNRR